MPTFKVTDPSTGRVVRLTGDSPPTQQELEQIFSELPAPKAAVLPEVAEFSKVLDEQGMGELNTAVQGLIDQGIPKSAALQQATQSEFGRLREASAFRKLDAENPELAQLLRETSLGEKIGATVGNKLVGLGRGIQRIPGIPDFIEPQSEFTKQAFKGLEETSGLANVAGMAAEAAPFLIPSIGAEMLATRAGGGILARGLGQTLVGGAEGGIIEAGKGSESDKIAKSAGIGGVIGLGSEVALPVVNRIRRALGAKGRRESQALDVKRSEQDIAFKPDNQAAKEGADSVDDPAKLEEFFKSPEGFKDLRDAVRRDAFEKLGLKPTKPQVTRDPETFQIQVDIFRDAKKDNKVRMALVEQEEILTNRVNGEIDAIGGDPTRAGRTAADSVINKSLELDAEISGLYKAARESAPGAKNVRFSRTAKSLRENAPIDKMTNDAVSAMRLQMKQLGFLDEAGKPTRLTSVEASEGLRVFANKLYDGANPLARGFLRDIKDAIDDDVFSAAGADFFKAARAKKTEMMSGLEATKGHKFDARKISIAKDILEGKLQPDKLVESIIGRSSVYKLKELREYRSYLFSGTPEQIATGARAWNDIRAAALKDIADKSFKGPLTERSTQSLSRAGLEGALQNIGPEKLSVLFSKDELSFIRDLSQVALFKEPVAGVKQTPSKPAIARVEAAIRGAFPIKVTEWVPNFSGAVIDKKAENKILKLAIKGEKIAKQNEKIFIDKMRRSNVGKVVTSLPVAIIPAIATSEEETK